MPLIEFHVLTDFRHVTIFNTSSPRLLRIRMCWCAAISIVLFKGQNDPLEVSSDSADCHKWMLLRRMDRVGVVAILRTHAFHGSSNVITC